MKSSNLEDARGLLGALRRLKTALWKCRVGPAWIDAYGVTIDLEKAGALRREVLAQLQGDIERLTNDLLALGVVLDEPQDRRVVGLDADRLDGTQDEQTAAKAAGENE